jgi:amidase
MAPDDSIAFAGIARQAEMLKAREVSSRELTDLYLGRIERLDGQLNSYRIVLGEQALAQADEADRRIAAGEQAPMLGVPIAIKDTLDLKGEVTALGTGAFDDPATADAVLTSRLRDAGAVFLGKTNLPELAICGFTESKTWGVTRNPWNTDRTTGGSSGGSGAAVAAGLAAGAHASDGAGSIRIPAAFCGLFGLKPTRGRVPFQPPEHWRGMSVNGAVTRTVADNALFLDVATEGGGDPGGPEPPDRPFAEAARTAPGRLRIATSVKPPRGLAPPIISDEVKGALADATEVLRSLGHSVEERDPALGLGQNFINRYLGGIHDDVKAIPNPEKLEARTRGFGRLGGLYPERMVHNSATKGEEKDRARLLKLWDHADVLVTPTTGEPAVEHERFRGKGALRTLLTMSRIYVYTPMWNHTGQPVAAVPMGFTDDGLPLSISLVGRPGDEATLISLAAQIEAERPWADRRPPIA